VVHAHIGVEGGEQVTQRAFQNDGAFRGAAVDHHQVVLVGKVLDRVEIILTGAVLAFQGFVGQVLALFEGRGGQFVGHLLESFRIAHGPHAHGDAGDFRGVDGTGRAGMGQEGFGASGEGHIDGHGGFPPFAARPRSPAGARCSNKAPPGRLAPGEGFANGADPTGGLFADVTISTESPLSS